MSQLVNPGKRIIILGGGLAGLSFAHYLRTYLAFYKKTNLVRKIILLEANDYMGGSVKSNVFDDNVIHELGPRGIRMQSTQANNTCTLIEHLGLSDRVLTVDPKSTASKERHVYRNGKMWPIRTNLWGILSRLPGTDKRLFQIAVDDFKNKKSMDVSSYPYKDPPLYDFVKYRFGEEAAESVLDPLLRGITAGDCRLWSTQGLFKDVFDREQVYGGVIRGMSKPPVHVRQHDELYVNDCMQSKLLQKLTKNNVGSVSFKTGLQTLPEHLSNSLLNTNDDDVVAIYNRTRAMNVRFIDEFKQDGPPCSVDVETIDGDKVQIDGDHLVAALSAKDFSSIMESEDSAIPKEQLDSLDYLSLIPHAPIGCVSVEYRDFEPKLPEIVNSFGFLTHSKAGSRLLGVSFDTASFPFVDEAVGSYRMTCMMGGAWAEQVFGTSDMNKVTNSQMEQIALEELREILKIHEEPYRMSTLLWKTGIAQYRPGHVQILCETREKIEKSRLPLTLLGQSYDGIAINDVIFSARLAAEKMAKSL